MALTHTPPGELGSLCPDFDLPSTQGAHVRRDDLRVAPNGQRARAILVMFICNHCPYVKAIETRLIELGHDFAKLDVSIAAISSNDAARYPDDGFEKMREKPYPFPYLYDESQSVAKAFGAVCTPDFFLYDADLKLAYRGRLDDSWKEAAQVTSRDLAGAITALLQGMRPTRDQKSSMGCSIKWKPGQEPAI